MTPTTTHFTPATFAFLRDLAAHNERAWFQANRKRYEQDVRDPAIRFINDFAPRLARISRNFRADPRPVGGSLFRIHRDTRFSNDKSPYKTHTGIHFRHDDGKDVHAPGFYVHLEPGSVFIGVGIWHPDGATLKKIRESIVKRQAAWKKAVGDPAFRDGFELAGDSLKRPPAGYDADHPLIEDLKRKDFIAVRTLAEEAATRPDFIDEVADTCRAGAPLNRFLCKAVEVPF